MTNIVNAGYDSTNYYVLGQGAGRLLVDAGWPGTLPKLLAELRRKDIRLQDIGYLLATHYHPDHAGLAQELKAHGARLIVLDTQLAAIPQLKTYMKPEQGYVEIIVANDIVLAAGESRAFLERIGLLGEIISTPGHSGDSVTLVLDQGAAFTGDLTPPALAGDDARAVVMRSWETIRALGATTVFPGHGPVRPLPRTFA